MYMYKHKLAYQVSVQERGEYIESGMHNCEFSRAVVQHLRERVKYNVYAHCIGIHAHTYMYVNLLAVA